MDLVRDDKTWPKSKGTHSSVFDSVARIVSYLYEKPLRPRKTVFVLINWRCPLVSSEQSLIYLTSGWDGKTPSRSKYVSTALATILLLFWRTSQPVIYTLQDQQDVERTFNHLIAISLGQETMLTNWSTSSALGSKTMTARVWVCKAGQGVFCGSLHVETVGASFHWFWGNWS